MPVASEKTIVRFMVDDARDRNEHSLMAESPLVLVADDEPSMLELVGRHLKELEDPKLRVLEASDGSEAFRLAQENLPDLIVLDVMMPGMSGWEVCRKIREDQKNFAHTAVIMLTGIGEHLNHMTSPLYGADFYIDKPFDFRELDKRVRQALRDRAAQRGNLVRPGAAKPSTRPAALAKPAAPKAAPKSAAKPASKKAPAKAPAKKPSASLKKVGSKAKPVKAKSIAKKAVAKKPAAKKVAKPVKAVKKAPKKSAVAKRPAPAKKGAKKK